jgi:hypothetical protein
LFCSVSSRLQYFLSASLILFFSVTLIVFNCRFFSLLVDLNNTMLVHIRIDNSLSLTRHVSAKKRGPIDSDSEGPHIAIVRLYISVTQMARARTKKTQARVPSDQPASSGAHLSLDALIKVSKKATEQHKHSEKTRKDYSSARQRAIKWLSEACSSASDGDILKNRPEYALAFEGEPNGCSGKALELYITQKCFVENRGRSTGEVAYSAMKKYWEEL